jgi:hypothetical protein
MLYKGKPMNEPIEDKTSGDEALVSKLYHCVEQEEPDQDLDNVILAMAKKHGKTAPQSLPTKPLPWWKKMQYQGAVAASVVLVSFVFMLQPQSPEVLLQEPSLARSPVEPFLQSDEFIEDFTAKVSEADIVVAPLMAQREAELGSDQAEEAELGDGALADAPMAMTFAAKKSMSKLSSKPDQRESLVTENKVIVSQLLAIQARLNLKHTQVMARASKLNLAAESEQKALIIEYLALHKKMEDKLRKILEASSQELNLQPYAEVLSNEKIDAFKKQ